MRVYDKAGAKIHASPRKKDSHPSLDDISKFKKSITLSELKLVENGNPHSGSKPFRKMQTILDLKKAGKVNSFNKLNAFAIAPETQVRMLTNSIDLNLRRIRQNSHQVHSNQSKFSLSFDRIQRRLSEETFNPTLEQKKIFYMVREKNKFNERMAWLLTWLIADKNRVAVLLEAKSLAKAEDKF